MTNSKDAIPITITAIAHCGIIEYGSAYSTGGKFGLGMTKNKNF